MCECFQVGGRFIAEDPDCPAHGRLAQEIERQEDDERAALDNRLDQLEERLSALEAESARSKRALAQIHILSAEAAKNGSEYGRRVLEILLD